MRKFAVLYKQPLSLPRAKLFDARSLKDALKSTKGRIEEYEMPLFIVDFQNERCEMIARGKSGRLVMIEDGEYGEMTDFERRKY